jgi:hypothetical protein
MAWKSGLGNEQDLRGQDERIVQNATNIKATRA